MSISGFLGRNKQHIQLGLTGLVSGASVGAVGGPIGALVGAGVGIGAGEVAASSGSNVIASNPAVQGDNPPLYYQPVQPAEVYAPTASFSMPSQSEKQFIMYAVLALILILVVQKSGN